MLASGSQAPVMSAASAGFGTPTALRLHFRKALDTSPAQYRRTFR